jgi:peroxiredoxin
MRQTVRWLILAALMAAMVAVVVHGTLGPVPGLGIGQLAPDITGTDSRGQPLRLSDYRGRVVVLSFWATWCGPCRAQLPEEKALVERFRDRPFAFLGVSGDASPETVNAFLDKMQVPWPNWVDGPGGAINTKWQVDYFPFTYVLDGKGVIRAKGVSGKKLQETVEQLLKEVE